MSYEIEYINKTNYLIRIFHGELHFPEIIASWEYLIEKYLKTHQFKGIINDFSDAQLKMELSDLDELMTLFKFNIKIFENLKLAVIMTSPDNIVFPVFAQNNSPFNIKAFSTIESATEWVLDL